MNLQESSCKRTDFDNILLDVLRFSRQEHFKIKPKQKEVLQDMVISVKF